MTKRVAARGKRSKCAYSSNEVLCRATAAAVEPLERRVMLSSAAGVEISGSSVGFEGKSLTFNADLAQGISSSGASYQWNLLNQYGSPYTPSGGLPSTTSSSFVMPGTVVAGNYELTLAVSGSGQPTQNATFPLEILKDPQSQNLIYGTVPSVGGDHQGRVTAMVRQPDGKIVVAGYWGTTDYENPDGDNERYGAWYVARFNADLTVDPSFTNYHGSGLGHPHQGPPSLLPGNFTGIQRLAINPVNQDIIVVGTGRQSDSNVDASSPWELQVAELVSKETVKSDGTVLSPGSFDPAFNSGQPFDYAATATDGNPLSSIGEDVKVLGNGDLLVAGGINEIVYNGDYFGSNSDFLLLELTPDGRLDSGFDGTGVAEQPHVSGAWGDTYGNDIYPPSAIFSLAVDSQGNIYAGGVGSPSGGASTEGMVIVKYSSTGTIDTRFGTGGVVYTASTAFNGSSSAFLSSLELLPGGNLLVVGQANGSIPDPSDLYNGSPPVDAQVVMAEYDPASGGLYTAYGTGGIVDTGITFQSFPTDGFTEQTLGPSAYPQDLGTFAFESNGDVIASLPILNQDGTTTTWKLVQFVGDDGVSTPGTLGTSFGGGGTVNISSAASDWTFSPYDNPGVLLVSDDSIIAGGTTNSLDQPMNPGFGEPIYNNSDMSQPLVVRYLLQHPEAGNLSAQQTSAGAVSLSWGVTIPGQTGFKIERSNSPDSDFTPIGEVGQDQADFVDSTALPDQQYYYQIVPQFSDPTQGYATEDAAPSASAGIHTADPNATSNVFQEAVQIPLNGTTVSTVSTLQAGQYYLVEASGLAYLDSNVVADPAYWYSSSLVTVGDGQVTQDLSGNQFSVINPTAPTTATVENYGIAAGTGSALSIPDWGTADTDHHSYFYIVPGTGLPLSFALQGAANFASTANVGAGDSPLEAEVYQIHGTPITPPSLPGLVSDGTVSVQLTSVGGLGEGASTQPVLPVLSAPDEIGVSVSGLPTTARYGSWQLSLISGGGASYFVGGGTSNGTFQVQLTPQQYLDGVYYLNLTANYPPPSPNSPPPPPPVSVEYRLVLAAPVLRITAPATAPDGVTPVINQSTPISVLSADPDGSQSAWSLSLVSTANSTNALLANNNDSVGALPGFGTTVATLDPSLYPNGTYELELKNGSGAVVDSRTVTIATAVKKGALQLPVTDGVANTPSGPVTITRTYDSSLVNVPPPTSADGGPVAPNFGPGWTFSVLDARLSTPAEADTANPDSTGPVLRAGDVVYLTVPDGGEQAFEFDPIPVESPTTFSASQTSIEYLANFVALDGSGATLSFNFSEFDPFMPYQEGTQVPQRLYYNAAYNEFGYPGATGGSYYNGNPDGLDEDWYLHPVDDTTFIGFNPADVRGWPEGQGYGTYSIGGGTYQLTEKDGTSYTIDATTGAILSDADASGNTTTYTYSAGQVTATNSLGATLFTVVTNAGNQVTSIVIPGQNPISYNYTAGNLTSVENQASQTTTYAYGDASLPHFLTDVVNPQSQTILHANYNDSTSMLASLVNANQATIPITYGQVGSNEIAQTVTDAAGDVTEEFFNEQTGTAVRKIQTLTDGSNVTGYIVTVANFNYVNNAVGQMSALRPSGEEVLQSVQNYNSFEVLGSDSAGVRFTQQPGTSELLSQTTFDTFGDVSAPGYGQVMSSSAEQDNAGTLKTTLYSDYAIVNSSGKREPLLTTVEIQTPDGGQPTGYDTHVQSQVYTAYTASGQLDYSLNVMGRDFGPGRDDQVGVFSDLGQGNFPQDLYINLSGFSNSVDNTTQALTWDAAGSSYDFEWTDGTIVWLVLKDTTLAARGSGLPQAGDEWSFGAADYGWPGQYDLPDGFDGQLDNLSFDGTPQGLSKLLAGFLVQEPFYDQATGDPVGFDPVGLSVPDFQAQGTKYSYTDAGDGKDTLVSQTQSVTATIGLDGSISLSPYATTSTNTYYTNNDYTQDSGGNWVPNAGASYGQVRYSIDAAGQETYYAYNAAGQDVFKYVYKQWTDSSGNLVSGWVGTTNVYDSSGRRTDTYQATYLDNATDAAASPHILPVTQDVNGNPVIDTNTADSNYVTPYYVAGSYEIDTQHTDYDLTTGRVADTKDQYGGLTSFTYDINGNKIETTYPNGTETLSVFDALNREIWTTNQFNPGGPNYPVLTHTIYNQLNQAVETDTFDTTADDAIQIGYTDQNGARVYNSSITATVVNGVLTPLHGTFVSAAKSFFDAAGHTIETIAPSGLRTGTIYFANGSVEYTGPLNSSAPDGGHPLTISDGTSTTGFTTSDFQVDSSTGYTTTLNNQFDPNLGLFYTRSIDQNGHATDSYTDPLGRSVRTAYADGSFTETLYGLGSNPVSTDQESDTIPTPTSWQYIPSGGSESVSVAQRKAGDTPVPTYDVSEVSNNLVAVYQPLVEDMNPADTATYYPTHQALVNPLTSYAYDTAGNEITQTDANGNATHFGFDQNGNQVLQKLPDGESETWTYNLNNQVTGHTDFDGNTATYSYESTGPQAGLLQNVVYAGAPGSGKATQTVTYGYNDLNQQSSVTDASGQTLETYDDFGNLTESDTPEGIIWYVFDPATGNHLETYTANTEVYYGYDIQGRLSTVNLDELNGQGITPDVTTYTYDPAGNKLCESDPNNDLIAYSYDALNRLKTETITDGSTILFNEQFTLNNNGTRATASETQLQPDGSTVTTSTVWAYDNLQRLTGETYTSSNSGENYSDVYTFDLASNRMSKAHTGHGGGATGTTTFQYNGDNELTASGPDANGDGIPDPSTATSFYYDNNGSQLTSTTGSVVTATFTYDVRNKMATYTDASNTAAYVYDDAGNRVQETANSATTFYLTDTQNPTGYAQPIEQKASRTAAPSVTYVIGDRVLAQADASGNVTYLLADGHGSTQQIASGSGAVTAAFRFDAFGTALNFTPANAATAFLFGGDAIYDPASGTYLHGNGVRPVRGFLFIQRDSYAGAARDPITLHKYLYGSGDPVLDLDPSGRFTFLGLLATGVVGAIQTAQEVAPAAAALGQAAAIAGLLEYASGAALVNMGEASQSLETMQDGANLMRFGAASFTVGVGLMTFGAGAYLAGNLLSETNVISGEVDQVEELSDETRAFSGVFQGTVSVSKGVANVDIEFLEKVDEGQLGEMIDWAKSKGATSAVINTGSVTNDGLAQKLMDRAISGRTLYGGVVELVKENPWPNFRIVIPSI